MADDFWDDRELEFQLTYPDLDFVNAVKMAKFLATGTADMTEISRAMEVLVEKLTKLMNEEAGYRRSITNIRRHLLAKHYTKITKSASSEIQDAFILKKAQEEGEVDAMVDLEVKVEACRALREDLEIELQKFKNRQKLLESQLQAAREIVNFEKKLMSMSMKERVG